MTRLLALLSRFLAVALLLMLLGGIYAVGVGPLIATYDQNEAALLEAQYLLSRFERLAATESDLQDKMQQISQRQALQTYYLTKETDALAAAELQDRVKAIVKDNGGTVRSIQTLPVEKEGEFQRVTLRMQMTTTIEGLFSIVYGLETSQPFLLLDNVDIKSRPTRETGQEQTKEPTLTVTIDLYGYRPPEDL